MGGFSPQVQQPSTPGQAAYDEDGNAVNQPQQNQVYGPQGFMSPGQPFMPYQSGGGKNQSPTDYQPYQPSQPQPMAKGGNYQNSATSGQPRIGQQNPYPNTVGQWDNSQIQPNQQRGNAKGKGG